MERCSVCGKDLPNKYALGAGGRCEEAGCDEILCSLHWNRGNRHCRRHGYVELKSAGGSGGPGQESLRDAIESVERPAAKSDPTQEKQEMNEQAQVPVDKTGKFERAKSAMREGLRLAKMMGVGAATLLAKLRKDKSPEAMLKTIDQSLDLNQKRSSGSGTKMEALFAEISAKKLAYEKAPPARKRVLEAELKTRLSAYKAAEREYGVLLENERILSETKGRMMEVLAYGFAGVSEAQIDQLIDEVEQQVDAAEGRVDAARDLDRAGKRSDRESDRESFADKLAEFDGGEPDAITPEHEPAPVPAANESLPSEAKKKKVEEKEP